MSGAGFGAMIKQDDPSRENVVRLDQGGSVFGRKLLGIVLLAGLLLIQSIPQASAQTFCDHVQFVADVTVPDGSVFARGATFTKTWRLRNAGTCTWTTAYSLVYAGGDQMGGPASAALPGEVLPGQTVDVSVSLTAPAAAGQYKGLWKIANASGVQFGVGSSAGNPFWVVINVTQDNAVQNNSVIAAAPVSWVAFDFLEYAISSQWRSGAGILSFPGVTGDSRGFANFVDQPHLEDGTFDTSKGLLMAPQNKYDGYIQMTSPNILISQGDKLETLVSCEFDAKNCYVTFRIDYLKANGAQLKFWSWKEAFDGRYYRASIDLSPLAGQAVRFVFMTLATGYASGDRALWVAPRIIRTTGGETPAPPTPTPGTPPTQPPATGGVIAAPYIRQLYMKDAFNGWAIGDSYLLRTTNGGSTWMNVSPPNAVFTNGATGFFSSSSTGWLLTGENKLYRTTNGGSTWTAYSVPFGNGYIQFTDSYHGFVLSGEGSGMNKQAVALYKTNDGGATWVKNYDNTPTLPNPGTSLPFSGHKSGMTFRDSLTGWVSGDIPMDGFAYFYRTSDAGKNWIQQPLALPAGYESAFVSTASPSFFGIYNAVLPVWLGKMEGRDLFIYSTTNGGISWSRSSGYSRGADFVDFVTSKNGFAWDHSGVFHVTANAGGTWTQVSPNVNFGNDFRGMDFVSTTTGWVIQRHVDNSTSLYKTTDGAATWTLLSTNKPGGTPTDTPVPSACDKATFVSDVTVLDGTLFAPGTPFTKTWRLKNSGSCTWTTSYKLIFQSGDQMGAPASINLPVNVAPEQTIDVSVPMTAPNNAGKYRGYWMLSNASGALFGLGENANSPFWVEINVSGTTVDTGYDFTANVCSAQWKSGGGILPCPGTDGAYNGFVLKLDAPVMEDGSVAAPGLLTSPQRKYDGYIQGFYPEFTVQAGDRFQAKVGCQQGYNCYLTYRLNYMTANGWIGTFWQWRESNDGKYYTADIDLTPLAGKTVRFILTTLATGYATDDRAVWSAPRIVRAGSAPVTATPPPPPTTTPTPPADSWLTFTSPQYGFQFQYPPGSVVFNQVANSAVVNLPIVPGTNLVEKYLDLRMLENVQTCAAPMVGASPTRETVTINGITFLKDVGEEDGAGQIRKWVAYNTTRNNLCVSFLFVLHSGNPGNYDPPRPVYDEAAESAVFQQMMQTFAWLTPAPTTPTPSSQLLPDLTILNMRIELMNTSCLSPGDSLGVRIWVTNNGQANAGDFLVTVNNAQQPVNGLAVGEIKALFFPGYTNPVLAMVDSTSAIAESNEANNSRSEMVAVPTAPLPCANPTPTPQDFATFGQNLVTVLNSKSFDLAKSMMDQSFGFAFWGSQGFPATPDQAVEQLQINYLGSTPLTANPYKDLNLLLDGLNPYVIMNLDPARSQALFVSGWGLDGKGEALLYMTRRLDGSIYWHSVLIAPTGFQPVTLTGPYAVVNVAENDSLNIRAGAGVSQPIIGYLSPDAIDVMRTGPSTSVDGAVWVEIRRNDGLTGWVNSYYLTEYVTQAVFCADSRVTALIEQLKQSMQQSDGNLLAPIVSPIHGVNMHLWAYGPGINFPQSSVANIYTDTTIYNWGGGPSGQPDTGTFNVTVKPKYLEVFNAANREVYCDTLTKVFPLSRPWPYRNIRYYNLYKPATPDVFFDFRTLLIGIEYINGQPYLYSMVTVIWEP